MQLTATQRCELRWKAAERQGGICCLCGRRMIDQRVVDYTCYEPRITATLQVGDEVRAACVWCVNWYHGSGKQEVLWT